MSSGPNPNERYWGKGWELSLGSNPNGRTLGERAGDVSSPESQCTKGVHFDVDGASNEWGGVAIMKEVTMDNARS